MPKKPPSGRRGQGQEALPLPHPACLKRRVEFHELRGSGFLPISAEQREKMEWEVLSLNVFCHPLSPYRRALRRLGVVPSVAILELSHGCARAAGLLESLQRPPTMSGQPVYFLLIEDETGLLQATIFERVYERYEHILHEAVRSSWRERSRQTGGGGTPIWLSGSPTWQRSSGERGCKNLRRYLPTERSCARDAGGGGLGERQNRSRSPRRLPELPAG